MVTEAVTVPENTTAAEVESLTSEQRGEWLKSGELPSSKAPEVKEEPKPKAEEVPAKEAEPAEDKGTSAKPEGKGVGNLGYKELRDRVRELEAKLAEKPKAEEPKAAPKAEVKAEAPRPKPTLADKDKDGNPVFKDYDEFQEALTDWKVEQKLAERDEKAAKAKEADSRAEREKAEAKAWEEKAAKTREKNPDYGDVLKAAEHLKLIQPGSAVDQFIVESAIGPELAYHFAQNKDDMMRIGNMKPIQAVAELVKLEIKLSGEEPPKPKLVPPTAKKVSDAPPPVSEVGSRQKAGADDALEALNEGDFDAYRRAANAKELKARKK